jgi:hypothetical protein
MQQVAVRGHDPVGVARSGGNRAMAEQPPERSGQRPSGAHEQRCHCVCPLRALAGGADPLDSPLAALGRQPKVSKVGSLPGDAPVAPPDQAPQQRNPGGAEAAVTVVDEQRDLVPYAPYPLEPAGHSRANHGLHATGSLRGGPRCGVAGGTRGEAGYPCPRPSKFPVANELAVYSQRVSCARRAPRTKLCSRSSCRRRSSRGS